MKSLLFSIKILALILSSVFLLSLQSEPIIISGSVMDETGTGLFGARVHEKNSTRSTSTDVKGKFQLHVSSSKAILEISYVGYEDYILSLSKIDLSKPIIVSLKQTELEDDEISISVGDVNHRDKNSSKPSVMKEKIEFANYSYPAPPASPNQMNLRYDEEKATEGGNYDKIEENEFKDPTKNPLSTLSIDVDRASYSNIRRFLQSGMLPNKDAVRIEEMINYFHYDYEEPSSEKDRPFSTNVTLTESPWNPNHKLMHVSLQAKKMERTEIPASNFVFLLDVSGSMNAQNKLPLLKSSLKLLLNQLTEKDRVAIVVYAGAAGCVLESTPGNEKEKILESLDALSAGGSTAGAAGIQLAYKIAEKNFIIGGNNRIILATDGDFNVGTSGDDELISLIEEKRQHNVFLSIMGFGMGNYKDSKMQKIADAGNGNHSYIDNMQEAKKVLMDEFGGTLFTVAKDVKIQIEFNPAFVQSYRMIGYENRVLADRDFNDDTKDAGEMGAGHSVTVLYEIIPVGVNSPYSASVDPLKYQQNDKKSSASTEIATIKYRYKSPEADQSIKSEEIIKNKTISWNNLGDDIKWSACVAEFGMLLRDSKYLPSKDYLPLITRTKSILDRNTDQYRSEFLDLVEIASALK